MCLLLCIFSYIAILISHVAAYFKKLSCVVGRSWNLASVHSVRSFHNFSVFLQYKAQVAKVSAKHFYPPSSTNRISTYYLTSSHITQQSTIQHATKISGQKRKKKTDSGLLCSFVDNGQVNLRTYHQNQYKTT